MDGKGGSSRAPQKRRFYVPTVDEIEARRSRAIALVRDSALIDTRTPRIDDTSLPAAGSDSTQGQQQSAAGSAGGSDSGPQSLSVSQPKLALAAPPSRQARLVAQAPAPERPGAFVGSSNTIIVNSVQRGNPILAHVRNVPWEYGEIEPDYVVGRTACVLFLSLRYHRLHPEYIYNRIERLKRTYSLRILLTFVDTDEHQAALRELNKIAIMGDMTLFLAWSSEEAGRYLETFKAYEFRSHDAIKERVEQGYLPQLTKTLTQIKSVNTTDVQTLSTVFGSLRQLSRASQEEIVLCPGFGNQKAKRVYNALHQPFLASKPRKAASPSSMRDQAGKDSSKAA